MIKIKITSILKKGTRFFANILDRGSAFNNIPFIQPGGFVKRYKESETQFGWVVEKEGRRYVVAVEGEDFPDLEEDEVVVYRDKNNYFKLDKDDGVELKTPNGEAVISKDQLFVKKDNATIEMKDGGMAFKKGGTVIELKSDDTIAMKNGATSLLKLLEKVYDSRDSMVITDSMGIKCTIAPLAEAQKPALKTLLSE